MMHAWKDVASVVRLKPRIESQPLPHTTVPVVTTKDQFCRETGESMCRQTRIFCLRMAKEFEPQGSDHTIPRVHLRHLVIHQLEVACHVGSAMRDASSAILRRSV